LIILLNTSHFNNLIIFNSYAPKKVTSEYPRWEQFDPSRLHYYQIDKKLSLKNAYRQSAAQFWTQDLRKKSGLVSASLTQLNTKKPVYRTLAWAMMGVSFTLLLLVILLLVILFIQRKKASFLTQHPKTNPSHLSARSSSLY
jgi:hypothetical protein